MVEKKYKDKEALVNALHAKIDNANAVILTEYRGIKATDMVKLRTALRAAQVEVVVVKNSLLRRAAVGTQAEAVVGDLAGPVAIALAYGEATEAAKVLAKGAGDFELFNLQNGVIEKTVLDATGIAAVAKLPGKSEMQSQFAGALEGVIGDGATRRRARLDSGRLSVVTVTHNSEDQLPTLLDSVARHLPGTGVVVVDCASRDRTVEWARRQPGVKVVALGENLGFGRACNQGLAHVVTAATALLNPDVEMIDDSLLELAAQALATDGSDRLLAPRVLNGDGSLQDTVHPLPVTVADLTRSLVPPAAVPGRPGVALAPWRADDIRRVGWAVGCALVARTDLLRALGPFDESIFMYGEDLDLGLRARQAGIETWFAPATRVVHHRAHSSRAAFGGEPFGLLARARHDVVRRRLGPRRAALDDLAQQVTFASRLALKRLLGRPAARERHQLAAARSVRREGSASARSAGSASARRAGSSLRASP